jgi:hypothetical protein
MQSADEHPPIKSDQRAGGYFGLAYLLLVVVIR